MYSNKRLKNTILYLLSYFEGFAKKKIWEKKMAGRERERDREKKKWRAAVVCSGTAVALDATGMSAAAEVMSETMMTIAMMTSLKSRITMMVVEVVPVLTEVESWRREIERAVEGRAADGAPRLARRRGHSYGR